MVSLLIFHVKPIIDLSSSVWSVGYLGDIRLLEQFRDKRQKRLLVLDISVMLRD